ncbi:hypothetical protein JXM83_07135 [Candidatus Woesearchaeota archaeon]|nr:hypothetical protein [Candidatus Woesearchaeota archaeon]
MDRTIKKKIAKEVLLLFGIFGVTILVIVGIWFYSLIIDNQIDKQTTKIYNEKRDLTELSDIYNSKFSKIKEFTTFLKTKEDEHWGSNLSLYLTSKELNVDKAVRKFEEEQSINGKIPNPSDSIDYITCIRPIHTGNKWSKYLQYTDKDLLDVWNCLSSKKEHLYYFLPIPVLKEFNISNKTDLVNFFDKYSLTKDELDIQTQINSLNSNIESLEQKRNSLQNNAISGDDIFRFGMISLITLLILAYPIRFIFLTIKWAIRTYREP